MLIVLIVQKVGEQMANCTPPYLRPAINMGSLFHVCKRFVINYTVWLTHNKQVASTVLTREATRSLLHVTSFNLFLNFTPCPLSLNN